MHLVGAVTLLLFAIASSAGQRITTIQLDGMQYFISRMNPYSPELNYFLSYQYCRSLGLQLASFETREKADSITQYLSNAGYNKYDFWISGNKLGTDMFLWMSTGLPFNATFNYMKKSANEVATSGSVFDLPSGSTSPQRTARESGNGGLSNSCVAMKAPTFEWDTDDCTSIKDFICEQTRCYYYNYGSIPVSSAQGKFNLTTTVRPYTSSSTIGPNHKYVPMGINELINKLRSSSSSSTTASPSYDDVDSNTAVPYENEESDAELSTNGPYDSFHPNAELQDDPAAIVDHHAHEEDYASTLEPDTATNIPRSFKASLDS